MLVSFRILATDIQRHPPVGRTAWIFPYEEVLDRPCYDREFIFPLPSLMAFRRTPPLINSHFLRVHALRGYGYGVPPRKEDVASRNTASRRVVPGHGNLLQCLFSLFGHGLSSGGQGAVHMTTLPTVRTDIRSTVSTLVAPFLGPFKCLFFFGLAAAYRGGE